MRAILTNSGNASLLKIGRVLFAIGIIALGIQQIVNRSLSSVVAPDWPAFLQVKAWAYVLGIALIILGASLCFGRIATRGGIKLGGLFLLLFLATQVPNQLFIIPYKFHLGLWTNPLKELALAGGAFIVAGSMNTGLKKNAWNERLVMVGRIFFSITMIAFGYDHFIYTDFVASLVPVWIPGNFFWTYLASIGLIGLGLALLFRIFDRIAGLILGSILIVWVIVLHIPRAIADLQGDKGNELTSVFEALAFAGIATMLASYAKASK